MDSCQAVVSILEEALGLHIACRNKNEALIELGRDGLAPAADILMKRFAAKLALMAGEDLRPVNGLYALNYVFSLPEDLFVILRVSLEPGNLSFPSLTPWLPAAHWYEREVQDMFGFVAEGHPDPRRLVLHRAWPQGQYPLRKDCNPKQPVGSEQFSLREAAGEGVFEIPVGPIHAGIIEPGHFRFSSVGEVVLNLEANLFYTHKGTEKLCEGKTLEQALMVAERVCGVCSFSHASAFCQAAEKLAGSEIPPRAVFLRTIALELERLYNHIGDIGNICAGTGFAFGTSQGGRLKERLLALNEQLFGNRYLRGLNRLGGVRHDLSPEKLDLMRVTLREAEQDFQQVVEVLLNHDALIDRLSGTGILKPESARDLGVVGPAARACGLDIDTRRDHPHLAYPQLQLNVVLGENGDVLDRFKVRIGEAEETFSLLEQLSEQLPQSELWTPLSEVPPYQAALGYVESPRGQNIHYLVSGPDNTVYRYMIRSASYTNWPAVPLAVQGNIVPDFPVINKSFELCYSCLDR